MGTSTRSTPHVSHVEWRSGCTYNVVDLLAQYGGREGENRREGCLPHLARPDCDVRRRIGWWARGGVLWNSLCLVEQNRERS